MKLNFTGILIAVICFAGIGVFHPIVIKAEYHFGKNCWPVFLVCGLALIVASALVSSIPVSVILGGIGCCCLWSIWELFEQEKRVKRGWFPENPKRKKK